MSFRCSTTNQINLASDICDCLFYQNHPVVNAALELDLFNDTLTDNVLSQCKMTYTIVKHNKWLEILSQITLIGNAYKMRSDIDMMVSFH